MIENEYAYNTFRLILKALRRANGRALRRREKRLQRKVQAELNKQLKYVLKEAKKLFTKGVDDDIDAIFEGLDDTGLVDSILVDSAATMKFGADYRIRKNRLAEIGISFTLDHPLALEYLKTDRPLVLAKMSETTKDLIKPILQDALATGQNYNDTTKLISDNFGFSKSRSQMIATNEIGHAYAHGNKVPITDAVDAGHKATKRWLTTGDDRVTELCSANESNGWIKFDKDFASGDSEAPRDDHPRCRCDTLYEID